MTDTQTTDPVVDSTTPAAPADATAAGTDQYGRQLFSVKCAACGKDTQVPFKPANGRPVYCRDCFMQRRGGDRGERRSGGGGGSRGGFGGGRR